MIGGSHNKRLGRHKNVLIARGDRSHTTIDEDNDCCPCPTISAIHTLVLLLSLTVVSSWVAFCFMEHSVFSHGNVILLRALHARCHTLVGLADLTATHASQLLLTHKNFIKGKIKAIPSRSSSSSLVETNRGTGPQKTIESPPLLATDFAAIYNLPALARNVEIELRSQTHMFEPMIAVFHKANTVGQMPFGTIPWEDYFLEYPSTSSSAAAAASSFAIPRDRLLSDAQVIPAALAARTLKGTTHPYAHLFNEVLTEGDYYLYNHTDKAPCEIHTISMKQDPACRWDSLQGESISQSISQSASD